MELFLLTTLLAVATASPMQQSLSVRDDGSYQFYYDTGKDAGSHSRTEVRQPDGVVIGKYSYEDANGDIREVSYRADDSGYVANGDVGVEGAPKSQFPATLETDSAPIAEVKEDPVEPSEEEPQQENDPKTEDLSLEETSSINDPPEGFPQGFFLQHFQGLRRLPEPTIEEEASTTTQSPVEEDKKESSPESQQDKAQPEEQPKEPEPEPSKDISNEMKFFSHFRPFQSFAPQPVDAALFHQPVYVFSYHNPDSYGYHYYF